jgi:hypothetical protein
MVDFDDRHQQSQLSQVTVRFLEWIFIRASIVFSRLKKYGYPHLPRDVHETTWKKVSSHFV